MGGLWSGKRVRVMSLQNGVIVCPEDGGGNLLTEEEFDNFVFRFEFKLTPGANNGVGIRAPLSGDIAYTGMEIQILDHGNEKYKGLLKPAQHHGSVVRRDPFRAGKTLSLSANGISRRSPPTVLTSRLS